LGAGNRDDEDEDDEAVTRLLLRAPTATARSVAVVRTAEEDEEASIGVSSFFFGEKCKFRVERAVESLHFS
jgi:hypothetical protein